jgi:hypothetical protein
VTENEVDPAPTTLAAEIEVDPAPLESSTASHPVSRADEGAAHLPISHQ